MTSKILFDANSTSTTSAAFYIPPGTCALINAWNLGPGEVATVWRALTSPGSIPTDSEGKCSPGLTIGGGQLLRVEPYEPCNTPVQVGETATQNITSLVLSQPGTYNLHLTPAALGTAIVEVVFLEGEDACAQAAQMCCCTPQQNFAGSSASPCLTITPGGPNGMQPVFDVDACCLLQSIITPGVPQLTDSVIIMQGGSCVRATLQDITDLVTACGVLQGLPVQAPAALDTLVGLDAGLNCVRFNASALVPANETPWAGVSATPALTITPGGVSGHAPTFTYDWCADLQAQTVCSCEPAPGDLVPIVQGGNCVLAEWPVVDLCAQINALTTGTLIALDTVVVLEAGGNCKLVPADDFGGGSFPLLAPNGTCANPSYSFAADPDSGLWDNAGIITLSANNCADLIEVGASINVTSTVSNIALSAPAGTIAATAGNAVSLTSTASTVTASAATSFGITTAATPRISIDSTGAWNIAGNPGVFGQQITSQGPGTPPIWNNPLVAVAFPLLAPTNDVPQYSFSACPAGGLSFRGDYMALEINRGGDQGSMLRMLCATVSDMVMKGETTNINGGRAANILIQAGEAQGLNLAPFQQEGGSLTLEGGRSFHGNGGDVVINGGASVFPPPDPARGGHVRITSGNGDSVPGNVFITAAGGNASYTQGGSILFRTNGNDAGGGSMPVFQLDHHNANVYGNIWSLRLPAWASARAEIYGQVGDAVNTRGQELRIWAGPGQQFGAGGHGGHLNFSGGNATGGPANDGGQMLLKGGDRTGTGIKGYVQLERVTTGPVAPPNPNLSGGTGYTPMVFVETGGVLQLWAWRQSDNSWRAVTFI